MYILWHNIQVGVDYKCDNNLIALFDKNHIVTKSDTETATI